MFTLNSQIDISSTSCKIVVRWVPQNPNDDNSQPVQVMALPSGFKP